MRNPCTNVTFLPRYVFELRCRTGRTDGRTDGLTECNAMRGRAAYINQRRERQACSMQMCAGGFTRRRQRRVAWQISSSAHIGYERTSVAFFHFLRVVYASCLRCNYAASKKQPRARTQYGKESASFRRQSYVVDIHCWRPCFCVCVCVCVCGR